MSESTSHTVDRSGWPAGAWDAEPDRVEWRHASGLVGLIVRNSMGALCGYVGLPPGHPLHGTEYGKIDGDFTCHGGLTYSDRCAGSICHVPRDGESADVWWLGFDCAHCWDVIPSTEKLYGHGGDRTYRDVGYVTEQVNALADQMARA